MKNTQSRTQNIPGARETTRDLSSLTTLLWDVPEDLYAKVRRDFPHVQNLYFKGASGKSLRDKVESLPPNHLPILLSTRKKIPQNFQNALESQRPYGGWVVQMGGQQDSGEVRDHFFTLFDYGKSEVTNLVALIQQFAGVEIENKLGNFLLEKKKHLLKESLRYLKQISQMGQVKRGKLDIEKEQSLETFLKFQMFLLEVKQSSFYYRDIHQFCEKVYQSSKILRVFDHIQWVDQEDRLAGFFELSPEEMLIPLGDGQYGSLLVRPTEDVKASEFAYLVIELLRVFEDFHFQKERFQGVQAISQLWGEAFQKLPYPVAIFNAQDELILHNAAFSKVEVLPKECLKLSDGEAVERKDQTYQVERREFQFQNEMVKYFTFHSSQDEIQVSGKGVSSEELGIISSSIAHELNNPIAGILAAISLLELEEGLTDEQKASVDDMRKGAKRCRDLIQVFLGFSRVDPKQQQQRTTRRTGDAFRQAVDLLRFRMIESDIRFEIDYSGEKEDFGRKLNASVMAMIFYLILGETLTNFSHHRLVMEDSENKIQAHYYERDGEVELEMAVSLDNMEEVLKSRLVQHLIEFEGLELETSPKGFKLTKKQQSSLFA